MVLNPAQKTASLERSGTYPEYERRRRGGRARTSTDLMNFAVHFQDSLLHHATTLATQVERKAEVRFERLEGQLKSLQEVAEDNTQAIGEMKKEIGETGARVTAGLEQQRAEIDELKSILLKIAANTAGGQQEQPPQKLPRQEEQAQPPQGPPQELEDPLGWS